MADETDRVAMVSDLAALKTDLLAAVERQLAEEREITRGHINDSAEELRRGISAEGEATRRHFDIVAEQMKDSVKVVARRIERRGR